MKIKLSPAPRGKAGTIKEDNDKRKHHGKTKVGSTPETTKTKAKKIGTKPNHKKVLKGTVIPAENKKVRKKVKRRRLKLYPDKSMMRRRLGGFNESSFNRWKSCFDKIE